MMKTAKALLAIAALVCLAPAAGLALTTYSQDFEGLDETDPSALANDGWLIFGNVFGPDWGYWYGYGVFAAPNGGNGFSAIVTDQGGAGQGDKQLSIYNDYNNADHGNGAHIEANVFQEQTIGAADVGSTWDFDFEAKLGNLEGSTTALAFIKTLDPNNGYAMTNFITADMTTTPMTWTGYTLSITIDAALQGQILQIGFASTATNYEGSGVFYDNLNFYNAGGVATEDTNWGAVKALY